MSNIEVTVYLGQLFNKQQYETEIKSLRVYDEFKQYGIDLLKDSYDIKVEMFEITFLFKLDCLSIKQLLKIAIKLISIKQKFTLLTGVLNYSSKVSKFDRPTLLDVAFGFFNSGCNEDKCWFSVTDYKETSLRMDKEKTSQELSCIMCNHLLHNFSFQDTCSVIFDVS